MKKRAKRMQALALERQQRLKKHKLLEAVRCHPQNGTENLNALIGNKKKQNLENQFGRQSGCCTGSSNRSSGNKSASASLREQLFHKDSTHSGSLNLTKLTNFNVTVNVNNSSSTRNHIHKYGTGINDEISVLSRKELENSKSDNFMFMAPTIMMKGKNSSLVRKDDPKSNSVIDFSNPLAANATEEEGEGKKTSKAKKDIQDILSQDDLYSATDEDLKEIICHVERINKSPDLNNSDPEEGKTGLKQNMIDIMNLVCKNKSDSFFTGFQTEWQKQQFQRILSSQHAARAAFSKQVDDEKRRESVAHTAWLYQMEKMKKKLQNMEEQLENVNEGILENETTLKRFRAEVDTVVCQEELQSTLQKLVKSSTTVRIAKDKCFMTEMARRVDVTLCIACQEEQKGIAFLPCKHFALCKKCYNRLPAKKCPICRAKIHSFTEVIIP